MKKIVSILIIAIVLLTGCGNIKEKHEQLIHDYFTCVKEFNVEGLKALTNGSDEANLLKDAQDELAAFNDKETYGETFVEEAEKYVKLEAEKFVESYEINKIEKDGDKYLVRIEAKIRDYSDINVIHTPETLYENYMNTNAEEVQKIYEEEGETQAIHHIFSKIAKGFFGSINTQIKNLKPKDVSITVVLEEKDNNWLITNVY